MGWKPTDEFFNRGFDDVKDLVEHWKETYGADNYACAQMLRAMSNVVYEPADDPEDREIEG